MRIPERSNQLGYAGRPVDALGWGSLAARKANYPGVKQSLECALGRVFFTSNQQLEVTLPILDGQIAISFETSSRGSILNRALVSRLVTEHNYVINLAAQTFVDNSIENGRVFFETNVLGTQTILEAARRSQLNKMVHISTDEVWGEAKGGTKFREEMPYAPRNPYAASKAAADHVVTAYGETYGLSRLRYIGYTSQVE